MWGYTRTALGAVAVLGGAVLLGTSTPRLLADPIGGPGVCPHETESSATGGCVSGKVLCLGQDTEASCKNANTSGAVWVVEFPTGCVTKTDMQCNKPLANCYQDATCKWEDGECKTYSKAGAVWHSEKKPTGAPCPKP
ncbi:MAG: hypothetical protein K2X82_02500 [Gemmataceae bacterium]|nr:hypothetical protein [Gemmataceae bacterium]